VRAITEAAMERGLTLWACFENCPISPAPLRSLPQELVDLQHADALVAFHPQQVAIVTLIAI
jgi:hypothetical protein